MKTARKILEKAFKDYGTYLDPASREAALIAMEEYASKKFTQGYTCACANLVRKTGDADGTLECELLGDNVSTLEGLKNDGVDESDIEVLKPTIAELERKRVLAGN